MYSVQLFESVWTVWMIINLDLTSPPCLSYAHCKCHLRTFMLTFVPFHHFAAALSSCALLQPWLVVVPRSRRYLPIPSGH